MMMRILLGTAGAAALVSLAAAAEPQNATTPTYTPPAAEHEMTPQDEAKMTAMAVKTRDDAMKLAESEFAAADANADGVVDAPEFVSFIDAKAEAAKAHGAAAPTPDEIAVEATAGRAFADYSKGDTKITKDEMVAAMTSRFDKADVNRDKALDAAEQKKFAAFVTVRPETADDKSL